MINNYKLLIISLTFWIKLKIIKSEWVELPQFSNNEKVYRTSFQFFHSPRNESEIKINTRPVIQSNYQKIDKFHKQSVIEKTIYRKGLENFVIVNDTCTTTVLPIKLTTESIRKFDNVTVEKSEEKKNLQKIQNSEDEVPVRNIIYSIISIFINVNLFCILIKYKN